MLTTDHPLDLLIRKLVTHCPLGDADRDAIRVHLIAGSQRRYRVALQSAPGVHLALWQSARSMAPMACSRSFPGE